MRSSLLLQLQMLKERKLIKIHYLITYLSMHMKLNSDCWI
jgi:hypothetical protein